MVVKIPMDVRPTPTPVASHWVTGHALVWRLTTCGMGLALVLTGCSLSMRSPLTANPFDGFRRHILHQDDPPNPLPPIETAEIPMTADRLDGLAQGSQPTRQSYLLPPTHPWSSRARVRGFNWPLVLNEGPWHVYEIQKGAASYYHEPQKLATGEHFDPEALTAAHRELPFGTVVRCTRTDTGASVVVIINDRGPFIDGRIIDLSLEAARRLNQLDKGIVPVELDVLAYPVIESMGPKGNG